MRDRRRRAFTLIATVSLIGTIALGVAILQTGSTTTSVRRAALAAQHARARVLADSASAVRSRLGPGVAEIGRLRLELVRPVGSSAPRVRVSAPLAGQPGRVVVER